MTSKVIHDDNGKLVDIEISCDREGCEAKPMQSEIIAGGGLMKMGWTRLFDDSDRRYKHFCPEHNDTKGEK